ncbi:MAG: radical SAM protein [Deltaproteobacteria bacterium]|nr:radical SAM protein [Deltaproteobacteria bacterium]
MPRWDLRRRIRARLDAEVGTLRRAAPRRLALCYPSPYPVAMASLGFQTIYREVNGRRGWAAERAFLPDPENEDAHARGGAPLCTYESGTPVTDFGALAFSVAYELELAGLARFLDLAGLPPRRADRGAGQPLVVGGGPLTYANARPLGAVADVVVSGEAEDALDPLLAALTQLPDRAGALDALAGQPGIWLPERAAEPGEPLVADDRHLPACSQITTPESELRDMFLVEVERGCSRSCRYCVMRRESRGSMRIVPAAAVLAAVPAAARRVGLVGAAVTDHPQLREILRALVDAGREVGISSARADRLDKEVVDLLRRGGQRTLTVAADGASQRLREALERHTSEEHLLAAGAFARAAGMRRLKVYQLVGAPGETDTDLDELVRFTRELCRIVPVALALSPLVPKAHTPLGDAPFGPVALLEARLHRLRAGLRGVAEVRAASARTAWIEHCLAKGGVEVGEAASAAARAGGGFGAWRRALLAVGAAPP